MPTIRADATDDLFRAAKGGTVSEVRTALSAGANLGARDEDGNTPLHLAAMKNDAPLVIMALIEGGADPGARDGEGATPFDYARRHNEALRGTDVYWRLNEARFE